jgi:multisubunit Na+/H+ antiporter MnhB subunit
VARKGRRVAFGTGRRPAEDAWAADEPGGRLAEEMARQELASRRVTETTSHRYTSEPDHRARIDAKYARIDAAVAEAEAVDQILERQHFRSDVKLLGVVGALLAAGVAVSLALVSHERPGLAFGTLCCALPILVAVPLIMLRSRARARKRASRERMTAARMPDESGWEA